MDIPLFVMSRFLDQTPKLSTVGSENTPKCTCLTISLPHDPTRPCRPDTSILELFNEDKERVLIGNSYSVLGTRLTAKFDKVPSSNKKPTETNPILKKKAYTLVTGEE